MASRRPPWKWLDPGPKPRPTLATELDDADWETDPDFQEKILERLGEAASRPIVAEDWRRIYFGEGEEPRGKPHEV